jgi:hypothetical protein
MRPRRHRRGSPDFGFAFLLLASVFAGGCADGDVGRVAGTVTLNGRPVTEGAVVFENAETGISVNAGLDTDGAYVVKTYDRDGLPPGTYRVAIKPATFGDGHVPLVQAPTEEQAPPSVIPTRYHDVSTSGLTAVVEAGENPPIDFALEP